MNIPLLGSLAYLLALVGADALLLFGPASLGGGMGIAGAGLGASIAQWVGAATVCGLLARRGILDARDLLLLPRPADVAPYVAATGGLAGGLGSLCVGDCVRGCVPGARAGGRGNDGAGGSLTQPPVCLPPFPLSFLSQ